MKIFFATSLLGALVCIGANPGNSAGGVDFSKDDFDCDNCDLKGPPVCGDDGTTYRNPCLAVCQDVTVAKPGACPGSPVGNPFSEDEDGVVGLETMNKFKEEKFKLVGKRKFLPLPEGFEFDDEGAEEKPDPPGKLRALRITEEGYEYEALYDEDDLITDEVELEPFDPNPEQPEEPEDRRDLAGWIVGSADERVAVSCTTCWPNRLVGQLDYYSGGSYTGRCSGTVVSRDSVLTAGHCVYDYSSSSWMPHSRFAPARKGTWNPYGYWYKRYMTTYTGWTQDGNRKYDMAVVKYYPNSNGWEIGDYVGYAGWSSVSDGDDSKLDSDHVKGYPGSIYSYNYGSPTPTSFPAGTMIDTGACSHQCYQKTWWWCSEDHLSKNRCDTIKGQSGSGVMSTSGYVHGIQVAAMANEDRNVAVLLHGIHVTRFKEWAGR